MELTRNIYQLLDKKPLPQSCNDKSRYSALQTMANRSKAHYDVIFDFLFFLDFAFWGCLILLKYLAVR